MSAKVVLKLKLKVDVAMACANELMKDPDWQKALDAAFTDGVNGDDDEIIRDMENMFSDKNPRQK